MSWFKPEKSRIYILLKSNFITGVYSILPILTLSDVTQNTGGTTL